MSSREGEAVLESDKEQAKTGAAASSSGTSRLDAVTKYFGNLIHQTALYLLDDTPATSAETDVASTDTLLKTIESKPSSQPSPLELEFKLDEERFVTKIKTLIENDHLKEAMKCLAIALIHCTQPPRIKVLFTLSISLLQQVEKQEAASDLSNSMAITLFQQAEKEETAADLPNSIPLKQLLSFYRLLFDQTKLANNTASKLLDYKDLKALKNLYESLLVTQIEKQIQNKQFDKAIKALSVALLNCEQSVHIEELFTLSISLLQQVDNSLLQQVDKERIATKLLNSIPLEQLHPFYRLLLNQKNLNFTHIDLKYLIYRDLDDSFDADSPLHPATSDDSKVRRISYFLPKAIELLYLSPMNFDTHHLTVLSTQIKDCHSLETLVNQLESELSDKLRRHKKWKKRKKESLKKQYQDKVNSLVESMARLIIKRLDDKLSSSALEDALTSSPSLYYRVALKTLEQIEINYREIESPTERIKKVNAKQALLLIHFIEHNHYRIEVFHGSEHYSVSKYRFGEHNFKQRNTFFNYCFNTLSNHDLSDELSKKLLTKCHEFFNPVEFAQLINYVISRKHDFVSFFKDWVAQDSLNRQNSLTHYIIHNSQEIHDSIELTYQPLYDSLNQAQIIEIQKTLIEATLQQATLLSETKQSNESKLAHYYFLQSQDKSNWEFERASVPLKNFVHASCQKIITTSQSELSSLLTSLIESMQNLAIDQQAIFFGLLAKQLSKSATTKLSLTQTFFAKLYEDSNETHQIVAAAILNQLFTQQELTNDAIARLLEAEQIPFSLLLSCLKQPALIHSAPIHLNPILNRLKQNNVELKNSLLSDTELPQPYLKQLLQLLSNENLVALLDELKTIQVRQEKTFNQVLYHHGLQELCARLNDLSNESLPKLLTDELLSNGIGFDCLNHPVVFEQLCSLKSAKISYVTDSLWSLARYDTNIESELRNKIIKLLNANALTPSQIKAISLNVMLYFNQSPQQLYALLSNIHSASRLLGQPAESSDATASSSGESSGTADNHGLTNYMALKEVLFGYLNCHQVFDEKTFWTEFHAYCHGKKYQDEVKTNIASRTIDSRQFASAAYYLAQVKDIDALLSQEKPPFDNWKIEHFIPLLLHSQSEYLAGNWNKCSTIFNKMLDSQEKQAQLCQKLFAHLAESKAITCYQDDLLQLASEFLLGLKHFNSILTTLSHEQRLLILKHRNKNTDLDLNQWITQLASQEALNYSQCQQYLQLILKDVAETDAIAIHNYYNQAYFNTPQALASLYCHINFEQNGGINCAIKIQELVEVKNSTNEGFTIEFLQHLLEELDLSQSPHITLSIINQLLIKLEQLNPNEDTHRLLIDKFINLITHRFIQASETTSTQQCHDITQLTRKIVDDLARLDICWINTLTKSDSYNHYLATVVKYNDKQYLTNIDKHPLYQLLVEHNVSASLLSKEVTTTIGYSDFATSIFTQDDLELDYYHYQHIFEQIDEEKIGANKHDFANKLLSQPIITPSVTQENQHLVLTKALSTEELYRLIQKNNYPVCSLSWLLPHQAINELSDEKLIPIIKTLLIVKKGETGTAPLLIRLLNSSAPRQAKQRLVDLLLMQLCPLSNNLNSWISEHKLTCQAIAQLLNYIPQSSRYSGDIQAIIKESPTLGLKSSIRHAIEHPDTDMVIEQGGLLYFYLNDYIQQVSSSVTPSSTLIPFLKPADLNSAIQQKIRANLNRQQMRASHSPITHECSHEPELMLIANKWNHNLPLLQILLYLRHCYRYDPDLAEAIEQTELFKNFKTLFADPLELNQDLCGKLYNDLAINLEKSFVQLPQIKLIPTLKEKFAQYHDDIKHHIQQLPPNALHLLSPLSNLVKYTQDFQYCRLRDDNKKNLQRTMQALSGSQYYDKNEIELSNWIDSLIASRTALKTNTLDVIFRQFLNHGGLSQLEDHQLNFLTQQLPSKKVVELSQFYQEQIADYAKVKRDCLIITQPNDSNLATITSLKKFITHLYTIALINVDKLKDLTKLCQHANAIHLLHLVELIITAKECNIPLEKFQQFAITQCDVFTVDWYLNELTRLETYSHACYGCLNQLILTHYTCPSKGEVDSSPLKTLARLKSLDNVDDDTLNKIIASYTDFYVNNPHHHTLPYYKAAISNLITLTRTDSRPSFLKLFNQSPELLKILVTTSIEDLAKNTHASDDIQRKKNRYVYDCATKLLEQILDYTLAYHDDDKSLLSMILTQLDQHHAGQFQTISTRVAKELLQTTASSPDLDKHTHDGIWIQRLLQKPELFHHLQPLQIQGLIQRYKLISRALKQDELSSWIEGTRERSKTKHIQISIIDNNLVEKKKELDELISNSKTHEQSMKNRSTIASLKDEIEELNQQKNKLLKDVTFYITHEQHILAFKVDNVIQEMLRNLQLTVEVYENYANGALTDTSIELPEHLSTEQARIYAEATKEVLSKFYLEIFSRAKQGRYQELLDSFFKFAFTGKGDLAIENSLFWRYAKRLFNPTDALIVAAKQKTSLCADMPIYNNAGERVGHLDSSLFVVDEAGDKLILLSSDNQLAQTIPIGSSLYDEHGEFLGNLSIRGKINHSSSFIANTSANILRYNPIEKFETLGNFSVLIADMIKEGQLNDLFGYLYLFGQISAEHLAKYRWLKQQVFESLTKKRIDLLPSDAYCFANHYELEQLIAIFSNCHNGESQYALLCTMLTKPSCQQALIKNNNGVDFYQLLHRSCLSAQHLENLFKQVKDKSYKALILSALLSHPDYAKLYNNSLTSITTLISQSCYSAESRMKTMANILANQGYPIDIISDFPEELSMELLLSINTYHSASTDKFAALFANVSNKAEFINFLLHKHYQMPLFDCLLTQLYRYDKQTLIRVISQLKPPEIKSTIIRQALDNHELISLLTQDSSQQAIHGDSWWQSSVTAIRILTQYSQVKLHDLFTKEDFIYAINHYLRGNNTSKEYLTMLGYLVDKKLTSIIEGDVDYDTKKHLSDDDLSSLFKLNYDEQFKQIHGSSIMEDHHYNSLIRHTADSCNTTVFYQSGRFSLDDAQRNIKQNLLSGTKVRGVLSRIGRNLGKYVSEIDWKRYYDQTLDEAQLFTKRLVTLRWRPIINEASSAIRAAGRIDFNQLRQQTLGTISNQTINYLEQMSGCVKAIDLFLSECPYDSPEIKQLINDYFNHLETLKASEEKNQLESTAELIVTMGVEPSIQQAIFDAITARPSLFVNNETICHYLYHFESMQLLNKLGRAGQYEDLISVCKQLLKPGTGIIDDQQQQIQCAEDEARLEQRLAKRSFLAGIRNWFSRIRFYGFSGFFKINKPKFVIRCDEPKPIPATPIRNVYSVPSHHMGESQPDLVSVLNSFKIESEIDKLNVVIEQIKNFRKKDSMTTDQYIDVLRRIDVFYAELKQHCRDNLGDATSIFTLHSQQVFDNNRVQLISQYQKNSQYEVPLKHLLDEIDNEQRTAHTVEQLMDDILSQLRPRHPLLNCHQQQSAACSSTTHQFEPPLSPGLAI